MTQGELKRQLHYDPETGLFTWLVSPARGVKVGDFAGRLTSKGYVQISISRKLYLAHRLAFLYMGGTLPLEYVDHINSLKSDNRWLNLRNATRSENMKNRGKYSSNKSGFKGVSFCKSRGKYVATCCMAGKNIHLGRYATAELASEAYQAFASQHHGEYYHA